MNQKKKVVTFTGNSLTLVVRVSEKIGENLPETTRRALKFYEWFLETKDNKEEIFVKDKDGNLTKMHFLEG